MVVFQKLHKTISSIFSYVKWWYSWVVPYLFKPPTEPFKRGIYIYIYVYIYIFITNKYPLYKVYMGLMIKGPHPKGTSIFPWFLLWNQARKAPKPWIVQEIQCKVNCFELIQIEPIDLQDGPKYQWFSQGPITPQKYNRGKIIPFIYPFIRPFIGFITFVAPLITIGSGTTF